MSARLGLAAVLAAVWVALWGHLSWANVLGGVVVAGAVLAGEARVRRGTALVQPVAMLRFLGYVAVKLVEASAVVAWEVVTPRNRINEGVVAVNLGDVSATVATAVGNAISLVPGTLTIEVRDDPEVVLYVHVLHLRAVEEIRAETLKLAELAVAAFGHGASNPPEDPGGPPRRRR